jgi:hypothetical protein
MQQEDEEIPKENIRNKCKRHRKLKKQKKKNQTKLYIFPLKFFSHIHQYKMGFIYHFIIYFS